MRECSHYVLFAIAVGQSTERKLSVAGMTSRPVPKAKGRKGEGPSIWCENKDPDVGARRKPHTRRRSIENRIFRQTTSSRFPDSIRRRSNRGEKTRFQFGSGTPGDDVRIRRQRAGHSTLWNFIVRITVRSATEINSRPPGRPCAFRWRPNRHRSVPA